MTLSCANCSAAGALIDRPGGGPFRLEVVGVRVCTPKRVVSCVRAPPSLFSVELPGLTPFCQASINCLCWSLTSKLLCSWFRIAGSCVWKPGDRQARPTSWMARPAESRAVRGADGRAVCGPLRAPGVLDERSSLLGRGRADCMLGDDGSFLTWIIGGIALRCLLDENGQRRFGVYHGFMTGIVSTDELGDTLALAVVRSLELLRAPWVGEALLLGRFDGSCAALEGEAEAAEVLGARA